METARQQAEAEAQQRLQTELARLEAAVEIQQLQAEIARLRAEVARMQGPGVLTAPAQRLQGPGVLTAPAQQIATGELRRSMHRTWAGAGMIGAGVMVFGGGLEFCNRLDRRRDPYNRELYAGCGGTGGALVATGIGVATLGALLVTVWADIPAMRNLAVAPTVGGFQVGSSFEF